MAMEASLEEIHINESSPQAVKKKKNGFNTQAYCLS